MRARATAIAALLHAPISAAITSTTIIVTTSSTIDATTVSITSSITSPHLYGSRAHIVVNHIIFHVYSIVYYFRSKVRHAMKYFSLVM